MRPYLLLLFLLLSTSMVGQVDSTVVEDADTLESLPNVGIKVDGYKYVVYPYNSKGYYLYQNERWDSLTVLLDSERKTRFGCRIHGIGPKGKIRLLVDFLIIPYSP